jgi:hypothetical protein
MLAVLLVAGMVGCAHRIDWNTRVGTYTFDQTVHELGPPDRSATLEDGSQVAEWRIMRGGRSVTYYGAGGYGFRPYRAGGGWYGYGGPIFATESAYPDHVLRLTFGPDKVLRNSLWLYK